MDQLNLAGNQLTDIAAIPFYTSYLTAKMTSGSAENPIKSFADVAANGYRPELPDL